MVVSVFTVEIIDEIIAEIIKITGVKITSQWRIGAIVIDKNKVTIKYIPVEMIGIFNSSIIINKFTPPATPLSSHQLN